MTERSWETDSTYQGCINRCICGLCEPEDVRRRYYHDPFVEELEGEEEREARS